MLLSCAGHSAGAQASVSRAHGSGGQDEAEPTVVYKDEAGLGCSREKRKNKGAIREILKPASQKVGDNFLMCSLILLHVPLCPEDQQKTGICPNSGTRPVSLQE